MIICKAMPRGSAQLEARPGQVRRPGDPEVTTTPPALKRRRAAPSDVAEDRPVQSRQARSMSVVTNQQLFSHTYLAQLQAEPARDQAAAPIAQGLRDWMPSRDASSLQALIDSWIGPVLDFLEFHHAPADDSPHIHLLYARRGDETPTGLCYVVPPGQGLDDTTKGRHPMAQTVLALRARDLRWGMLTDGVRWRLVDAQSLRRYEHYVEVDLDELARSDDPTPLRLFHALFHRSAFTPTHPSLSQGEGTEGIGLDRLVQASVQATKVAEDHLKARVSHNEGIMAQLCLGLVRADERARYTEVERDAIYRDATYLLYRILFILYAEARGLLPVNNPAYGAVSLAELVKTAQDYKLRGMPDPQATTLWERLKQLCDAIYESDPALGIPAYNGGLFDDADKPCLRDGHIADMYLSQALFDLAYMPDQGPATSEAPGTSYRAIDYRDLSVRHLGSLYEGMIEYKLQIAEETLWARRDSKNNVRFLRTGQDGAPRKTDAQIEPGQVYFSQSPGERRATGTYYTPEYIVDYIVRQTVVRGLEERRAPVEEKLAGWLEELAVTADPSERARMQRAADEELLRFVEEQVLTFRVCDIGMGSGHFLVNTAHQITNFIVEILHLTPWENDRVDTDPVAWRRRVVERCLYGVDLSLMAVELAKLSLWLASVAEGKPLSFLDHHLRQGNSLIGARLEDLAGVLAGTTAKGPSRRERKAREAGQLSMLDDPVFAQHVTAATDLLAQISARVVERVEDVKAQEADYENVRAELEPYRQLADLWTARHFGVDVEEHQLQAIGKLLSNSTIATVPAYKRLLTKAAHIASESAFFHWDLEFPEIFLVSDDRVQPRKLGFNAVVGNPPYGAIESLPRFTDLHKDSFVFFWKQSLDVARQGAYVSLITPAAWLTGLSFQNLRGLLLDHSELKLVVGLPYDVFPDAYIDTCVAVVRNHCASSDGEILVAQMGKREDPRRIHDLLYRPMRPKTWRSIPYQKFILDPTAANLQRFHSDPQFIGLGNLIRVERGVQPYSRRKHSEDKIKTDFLRVDTPPANGDVTYYPELLGEELTRYRIDPSKRTWLPYSDALAHKRDEAFFRGPRVVLRRLLSRRRELMAAMTAEPLITTDNILNILVEEPFHRKGFICALLNSKLLAWLYTSSSTISVKDDFPQVTLEELRRLPIPRITFATPVGERKQLAEKGQRLYGTCLAKSDQECIIGFVEHQLSQEPERADVVHDLLAYLAEQMIDLHKERQRLEGEADLFRFVPPDTPCLPLDKALGGPLSAGEATGDLSAVHHDIEGLRLTLDEDGRWLLEIRAKLRDPESGWREHQRDGDGNFVRWWLPAYRLPLDEATGRFYHYAFAHLDGFAGAGKFPGGFTRTTLKKLKATQVPKFVPVDLAPLAALEAELTEVRRKIRLTDDLIDQIVYKLYGLTEEEIAIVEGRLDHE